MELDTERNQTLDDILDGLRVPIAEGAANGAGWRRVVKRKLAARTKIPVRKHICKLPVKA